MAEQEISDGEVIDLINDHLRQLNLELLSTRQGIQESLQRMDRMDEQYKTGAYSNN